MNYKRHRNIKNQDTNKSKKLYTVIFFFSSSIERRCSWRKKKARIRTYQLEFRTAIRSDLPSVLVAYRWMLNLLHCIGGYLYCLGSSNMYSIVYTTLRCIPDDLFCMNSNFWDK